MNDNKDESYDLVIVGAGIHGTSIAHEASKRKLRVLLIEQYDKPAKGTSSKSSKLIHGGLRYLESLELNLVYECLSDRHRLLRNYPDLVRLQKFYIPIYKTTTRSRLSIRTGLSLYALLGGLKQSNMFHCIKKDQWHELDGLSTDKLLAVYQYYDAQTDDAMLTTRLIDEAREFGAEILFNCDFIKCETSETGVSIGYQLNNVTRSVSAKYMINAAGPWVNHVIERCEPTFKPMQIELIQGAHIEVAGQLKQGIYYLESPQDQRAVFAMPWKDHIMIGTTETVFTGNPADCSPTPDEIKYLLSVFNHYFSQTNKALETSDVINSWAGLRVLPKSDANPFKRTRETIFHPNHLQSPTIYSIYGGKLTSHYSTAIKLLKRLKV